MSTGRYVIDKIRKQVSIVQYLQKKGIYPAKNDHGGVRNYICPIHKDTDPSMRVWQAGVGSSSGYIYGHQTYKCFGCGSGSDIIALHAAMCCDKNYGRAIRQLAGLVDVSVQGQVDFILKDLRSQGFVDMEQQSMQSISLKISSVIYDHLQKTQFDKDQVKFINSVLKVIDKQIWSFDTNQVNQAYQFLTTKGALKKRYAKWAQNKRTRQLINARSL